MRLVGHAARMALIVAAVIAAAASAGSNNQKPAVGTYSNTTPPPPQQMDPQMALGLWKSSFGAVKIETNDRAAGAIHGVWVYDRQGTEVIGYFGGTLNGNILEFTWQEPTAEGGQLTGAGYLVFETYGARFSGRWWTTARDRMGEWTGWRASPDPAAPAGTGGATYGGATYGTPAP